MIDADRQNLETRVLLLAPTVKDAELTRAILGRAGIACIGCADPVEVCEQLAAGAGAVLIAEEAVHGGDGCLAEWLARQPPWSDLPVLILARAGANSAAVAQAMEELGNVTVLERPARVAALVSAARSALRARQRQYQLRDQLIHRDRVAEQLDMAMAAAHAGSWHVDLATGEFSASARAIELHGLPPGTPLNHERALACAHPDDRTDIEAALRRTFESGQPFRHEYRVPQPDGSVRWVSSHAERQGDGRHACVVGHVQDITERKRAELRLRASEEFNRSLMDGSTDCLKVMDTDGQLQHMNAPGLCLMEIDDFGPLCGRPWPALWPAEVRPDVERAVAAAVGGDVYSFQAFCPTLKGTPKWWEVTVSPVREVPDGPVVRLLSVSHDITQRRQSEQKLAEALRFYHSSIDALSSHVAVLDENGVILEVNQAWRHFAQMNHFAGSAYGVGTNYIEVCETGSGECADDGPIARGIRDVLARRSPLFEFEYPCHSPTEERWFLLRATLFPSAGPVRVVITHDNVTQRRAAEAQLRESNARLTGILRQSPAGIVQTDAQGRMTLVNERWCQMLGYPEAALLGRSILEITHPSFMAPTAAAFGRLAAGGPDFQIEKAYSRKDSSVLSAQSNVAAIRSPDGEFLGLIAVVLDISERLRTEEELRRLAAELSEADRRKDEFLATLAHELRNPLAPIRNGLQVMKLTRNNGEAFEQVRAMMDRQLSQMVRLVDDLLDVSRITQGKVELRKQPVALKAVIDAAVETSRSAVEEAGHELAVVVTDEPIFVDGDATRLAQVVSNLLNNSAKYTHRGGHVRLTVGREGGTAVVSVKDDGIGIPPAMIGRVFEMFTQVDRTLEKTTGGLGIGLSLVKGLLEMHGGTIEARSDGEGMGSEFVVRLPVAMAAVAGPDRPNGKGSEVVPSALCRILIVDDNVDSADSLAQMLEMSGHEVRTANDGEAGIAAAAQFRPGVVLMDIGMPKLNGYVAARRIRQHPWGRAMVLVALTGWGQEDDRKKSADAGFDHHLVKPVELDALMKLISDLEHTDLLDAGASVATPPSVANSSTVR